MLAEAVPKFSKFPHEIEVAESTINQSDEEIATLIESASPDIIGISTYIWNARKLPGMLKLLRERLPNVKIILGGPEATFNAEYWLGNGADIVVRGEGERSFAKLLDDMENGKTIEAIIESEPPDEFTNPQSTEYFASLDNRLAYIETSRGCPFCCAFCLSAGTNVHFMPLEQAFRQIEQLSKTSVQTIKFVDRTFNCNAERAYQLFGFIIGLDTKCCFHFEVGADLFDKKTLELLATAPIGRIQFEAGLQSFFEATLKAVSRQTDQTLAEQNIRIILANGNIHVHVDLIAGLPFETLPNLADSFDRAFNLNADVLQLGFLKMLHGSILRNQNTEIVYNQQPPYEIISSRWLSVDDLLIIKKAENALNRTYNKGRFRATLKYVLDMSKLRPFELFRTLGETAPNHGIALNQYAERIFECFVKLPNVNVDELRNCMIEDWIQDTKGERLPKFLKA